MGALVRRSIAADSFPVWSLRLHRPSARRSGIFRLALDPAQTVGPRAGARQMERAAWAGVVEKRLRLRPVRKWPRIYLPTRRPDRLALHAQALLRMVPG